MKVTIFNGSPRGRNSNSHRIVKPFLEGAEAGGADVSEIFLIENKIEFCRGCFSCWGNSPGVCIIKDDMEMLIDLFLGSDFAGFATPVYGMFMTAVLKNFQERLLPLATPHIHRKEDGSFYHKGRIAKFPRQFFIVNSGFPGTGNFELFKAYAAYARPVLEIYRNCGEALNVQEGEDVPYAGKLREFQAALREAGRELVEQGEVSSETLSRVHLELMSDEEYMAGANQYWDEKGEKSE